jgi:ectoine hydroxylase-related dioxygenase (phytanoyl-CoA dioxygenase family)
MGLQLEDLSEPAPEPGPADWNDEGVVILSDVLDPYMVEDYMTEWEEANGYRGVRTVVDDGVMGADQLDADRPGGWPYVSPYMEHPALMAMCCQKALADELERLLGRPAGVHLNLTGWVSTQRDWHQDGYLNPEHVGDAYAAVWMALDDIHPDSGVFQYIPGSHRWHRLLRSKVGAYVDLSDPAWPKHSEDILSPLVEAELRRRELTPVSYAPNRGDVLIWHPRLYHRGSTPTIPNAYRPALIAHYSGLGAHPELDALAPVEQHALGGWYWPIQTGAPV